MAEYRIVCTIQEPRQTSHDHARIVVVGTVATNESSAKASRRWTLDEVLLAMKHNDKFWTYGDQSKKWAAVKPFYCSHCQRYWIKSDPDAVKDNNLDNLRVCNFQ